LIKDSDKKMEENSNQQPKEVTLNDLAAQMASGFERIDKRFEQVDKEFRESRKHTEKLINKAIEELATSTQKEFLNLNSNIEDIKTDVKDVKANLHKKVDRFEYNDLTYRVEKTEEKLGLKPKLKFA